MTEMEKPNRAERRRNKFGGGRSTEHGGWPTVQPNPVFAEEPEGETAAEAAPDPPTKPAKPAAKPPAKPAGPPRGGGTKASKAKG